MRVRAITPHERAERRSGFEDVANVEGGAPGRPIVRGERRVISLERQVRIAAGSLVVAGTTLGFLVHPYFLGLSAFVGGGLVLAGVTDTCGMALILSRLPWNRARAGKGAASSC